MSSLFACKSHHKNCFILLEYCKRSDTPRCFEPLTISLSHSKQYATSLVLRALFPGNLQGQQQSREVSSFIAGSKSLNRLKILNLTLLTSPTNSESKPSTFYFTFQKTKHICTVRYKKWNGSSIAALSLTFCSVGKWGSGLSKQNHESSCLHSL